VSHSETWRDQRERRYQLGREQALATLKALATNLPQPTYVEGSRRTLVVTTYLDSPARDYLRMVEESAGRVSLKVRIREYIPLFERRAEEFELTTTSARVPVPNPVCFLERKERIGEVRQKHRVSVDKRQVGAILRREVGLRGSDDVVAVLEAELAVRQLEPVLVSAYERRVFGSDHGLRVTFDERLRFHEPPAGLYDRHPALTPHVLGDEMWPGPPRILEVKQSSSMPTPPWLEAVLGGLPDAGDYSKFRDGMASLAGMTDRGRRLTRPLFALD
jgi:hypothetical protein